MSESLKKEEFVKDGLVYIREYHGGHVVEYIKPSDIDIQVTQTPEPYQPTNAEVAQMISDLQADLIIAGVI